jgi:phospholipid N-methyltransferase
LALNTKQAAIQIWFNLIKDQTHNIQHARQVVTNIPPLTVFKNANVISITAIIKYTGG